MSGPRLLFSTAAFFARPLDDSFRLIAECGFTGVEVLVTSDPASQDAARMRASADRYGLQIGAIHDPSLLLTRWVWGSDRIKKIDRAVEVAGDAGVPLVVTHPPYRWQREARTWFREELPKLEQRTGILVGIENMYPLVHVGFHPLMLHADQDLDDLEGIRHLVLDTSHAAVAKHDLIGVRRRFGDRLRHIHLSDNAGKGWDSHLPPGQGVVALDPFLDDLVASGFTGTVSLEVDLRRYLTEPKRLRAVMEGMRARTEARLNGSAG
jgi:sugar phosphate isomerase/epimerase